MNIKISRREALKLGLLGSGALLLPVALQQRGFADGPKPIDPPPPFQVALRIPPVLTPTRTDATTDYYDITQSVAKQQIIPGLPPTTVWGFNGITPGPTIIARRNREVVIRQTNTLPEAISTHLHGMTTQMVFDGYPEILVEPGSSYEYRYPNLNHAATLWYHDHAIHHTSTHVYQGLSAFYIIHDEVEESLPLPKGDYDLALNIQDKLFAPDGSFIYDNNGNKGVDGNIILVNGTPFPRFEVANRKYRFRILNGSDKRSYKLALSTGQPFTVIGTDSGLMTKPQQVSEFRIGTAERYEVVIDFSQYKVGSQIVLQNLFADKKEPLSQIMRFDVARQEADNSSIPDTLRNDYEVLQESQAARTREFRFERSNGLWQINGKIWDANRADATPKLGDVEIWRLYNNAGGWFHPIHLHLLLEGFRILDRNGAPPFPYELGQKDVAYVGENESVRVIGRFVPFKGKFVFHCHNASHEDHDMMSQFEVI